MTSNGYEVRLPHSESLSVDSWLTVSGGALGQPIEIKLGLIPPDTPTVLALRIDNGQRVSSRELHALRLPRVAASAYRAVQEVILQEQDRASEWQEWADGYRLRAAAAGPGSSWHDPRFAALAAETDAHATELRARAARVRDWLAAVADASSDLEVGPRGRGAGERTDEQVRDFARVYLEELEKGERGVMTRTAKRTHMTRPNAYRWLEVARDRGVLPKKEGDRS